MGRPKYQVEKLAQQALEAITLNTNVLIEILKDNQLTQTKIAALQAPFSISSITAMELLYGAKNKREVRKL